MKIVASEIRVGDIFEGKPVGRSCRAGDTIDHIWFFEAGYSGCESAWHYRRVTELVEVERPLKLVTVTVELTEFEAGVAARWRDNLTPIYVKMGVACRRALGATE